MSFLSLVVYEDTVSMVADKMDSIFDTKTNTILTGVGKTKKLYRVGEYGFYAMAGNATVAQSFIHNSGFLSLFSHDGIIKGSQELEQWFNENGHMLSDKWPDIFSIYFGGMTKDNQVCAFTLDSTQDHLLARRAKKGCYSYSLSASPMWENDKARLNEKFEILMRRFDGTIKSVQGIQNEMNRYIASYDPSVSIETDCFALVSKNK
jgi:hypothetical protein